MKYAYIALLIFSLLQAVVCLLLLIFRKAHKNTLRYSKILVIAALLCTAPACFISVYCLAAVGSGLALTIDIVFLLCGNALLYPFCRWRLCYGKDSFEVRPCFGRERRYAMSEICGITSGTSSMTLHLKNGTLRLDSLVKNREDFIRVAYRRSFALPQVPEKLFHGYVRNPWSFLGVFLMLDLLILAGMVLLLCLNAAEAHIGENELLSVTLTDYTVHWEEDTLELHTAELRQPYYMNTVEAFLPEARFAALQKALEESTPLTVFVERDNYEDAKQDTCNFLKIKAMETAKGALLISQEDIAAVLRADMYHTVFFMGAILLLFLAFEGWFCYIASHAPQYPRQFRLLVKEEWRNI